MARLYSEQNVPQLMLQSSQRSPEAAELGKLLSGERVVGMDGQGVVERGKRETQATSKHTKLRGNNA